MIRLLDLWKIFLKYFRTIAAICLLVGIVSFFGVRLLQTYTCTLNYSYSYAEAAEGLAPNGKDELDPYELKNPAVLQAAIDSLDLDDETLTVEGIRNKISISEVITTLDQEVTESAAILGNKYEITPTEFLVTYSYKASLGEEYGVKLFDGLVRAYDDFIISKYYNKKHVSDFMQNIDTDALDYLELAAIIENNIEDAHSYLVELASEFPDFRSVRTGYSFAELATMYADMQDVQYSKYYGNIRAGNLSKDTELTIANYNAKIKDLESVYAINCDESENYKELITTYYDKYKEYGLYQQATTVHTTPDSTNQNDNGVFRDLHDEFDKLLNTYDKIVQYYTDTAGNAASAARTIEYYRSIIDCFANDTVTEDQKAVLLLKNEKVLDEIRTLASEYALLANASVDEVFEDRVADDIRYLISTDIAADKPALLITIFAMIAVGCIALICVIFYEVFIVKMMKQEKEEKENSEELSPSGVSIDVSQLDAEHRMAYEQFRSGFSEFFMVYQPMFDASDTVTHFESFIRWESAEAGPVPPSQLIELYSDLGLLRALSDWIIARVCKDIPRLQRRIGHMPVVHINCLCSEILEFGLNSILLKNIRRYKLPSSAVCMELDGADIMSTLEDVFTLGDMGFQFCVDHFENKEQENEILRVLEPRYVKMSSDIFTPTMPDGSIAPETVDYLRGLLRSCEHQRVSVCICGVENRVQDRLISGLGFRYRQGYYYMKPMRLKDMLEALTERGFARPDRMAERGGE